MDPVEKNPSACAINRKYLPVKVSYFTLFAGMASLWNFIALHMKSLGLSPSEIGIITGVPSFLGAFSTIAGGAIADKFRIHSQLCGGLTIVTTFLQVLLLFIPTVIHEITTNTNCAPIHVINSTWKMASLLPNTAASDVHPNFTAYPLELTFTSANSSFCVLRYYDGKSSFALNCDTTKQLGYSNGSFDSLLQKDNSQQSLWWNCSMPFGSTDVSSCDSYKILVDNNITEESCTFIESLQTFSIFNTCDTETSKLQCTEGVNDLSKGSRSQKNFGLTFWIYFSIYGFAGFLMNPIWPLLNAIAYALLGNERNSWGKQRLWGTIGDGLVVLPMSLAMHFYGSNNKPSFIPNFTVYFIVTIISGIFICCSKGKVKVGPAPSIWRDLKFILKIWETYMLLILGFVFGSFLGALSTLLPLYITDFADGNEILVALSVIMNIVGEVPMLYLAKYLIDRIGYVRCLYLSCLAFALRFFLYVIISDPWYILPVNLLHGFTYGIMYSSLTAYMSSLTPPALHGTTQGLISTLTWNLGFGCGNVVSGEMMDKIGAKRTFASLSVCSLATLVIYFAYINIIVRICTWNQEKKGTKEFKLVTPATATSGGESEQLLLTTDNSDLDD